MFNAGERAIAAILSRLSTARAPEPADEARPATPEAAPDGAPATADEEACVACAPPHVREEAGGDTARPTVLVADDDHGIRQVLEFVFDEEGFDVRLAQTAAEARCAAATITRGVVVVDLKLGRDDGMGLAGELAARPDLAVVIVSAEPSLARRAAGSGIAAHAVLTKPFELAALVEEVRRAAARIAAAPAAGHSSG